MKSRVSCYRVLPWVSVFFGVNMWTRSGITHQIPKSIGLIPESLVPFASKTPSITFYFMLGCWFHDSYIAGPASRSLLSTLQTLTNKSNKNYHSLPHTCLALHSKCRCPQQESGHVYIYLETTLSIYKQHAVMLKEHHSGACWEILRFFKNSKHGMWIITYDCQLK